MPTKKNELNGLIETALKSLNQTISVDVAYLASAASEAGDGAQAFIHVTPFNTNTVCYKILRKSGELKVHHSSTMDKNGKWRENFRKASPAVEEACKAVALEHYKTM